MRRLIVFCGVAAALLVCGCGQVEQPAGESPAGGSPAGGSPAAAPEEPLRVERESDDGLAGTFRHVGGVVAFSADTGADGATKAQITLDERVMTASRNRATGQGGWSGGGSVLTQEDRDVLLSLAAAFRDEWGQAAGGQPSGPAERRDLLLRLATLLAEAPLGVPLGDH